MKCQKCWNENLKLEESHDIPKYLGGVDNDGKHLLCLDCHDKYEMMILSRIFLICFKQLIPYTKDRRKWINYMNKTKRLRDKRKILIAERVREEFYDTQTITTS